MPDGHATTQPPRGACPVSNVSTVRFYSLFHIILKCADRPKEGRSAGKVTDAAAQKLSKVSNDITILTRDEV
jgi:hypothetical protein